MAYLFLLISFCFASDDHSFSTAKPYSNGLSQFYTIQGTPAGFPLDYALARLHLREAALEFEQQKRTVQLGFFQIPNTGDNDLTQDHMFIPNKDSKKLFILSSGTHGAEFYAGHAIQMMFIKKLLANPEKYPFNVLILHAMNPYGAKYFRRPNPNNVDLNRNSATAEEFKGDNAEYTNIQYLFNPDGPASTSFFSKAKFYFGALSIFFRHGKKMILNGLRGQYKDPSGIFYGGAAVQPEIEAARSVIKRHAEGMEAIYHVDLHTGFGERGKLHFFGNNQFQNETQQKAFDTVFAGYNIDTGNSKDFYPTIGGYTDWTAGAFPDKKVVAMTFEFGTLNSQTIRGGLRSMWTMAIENQAFQQGVKYDADRAEIRRNFEELFNPQDPQWQQAVLEQGAEALETTLSRF